MSFMDILIVPLICVAMLVLTISIFFFNPLQNTARYIRQAVDYTIIPSIDLYVKDNDRLFVVEPERSLIYNTAGAIYYYFEGGTSGRICPHNEHAIVRLTSKDIELINKNGVYNITCTNTSPVSLYNHFTNEGCFYRLPFYISRFTIIDLFNILIESGFAGMR
ncbi:Per os infectio factor 4 [Epinotia aporema granulovirus]|uniref:Per os infectio factor 4 n=1 Tax=Epinotia aporema granulovirus TaxID=166056 RepID=K4ERU8_9BBAC|nr:Per os infectio factor 4 [Epinotia aporema granulovirus]AER41510.1 Per os infectio factor 4 [Epinotia aporema granulovirus]